ncbi:MAG: hypothetical protein WCU88_02770 [Elusimicrobiota bacterium]|jgi:hypothetical protein
MIRRSAVQAVSAVLMGTFFFMSANVHANMIAQSVGAMLSPNIPMPPVPASLRSCVTPAQPAGVISFVNELRQLNNEFLRPTSRTYREPLRAALYLEGSREFDRMLVGLMPNAEKLQAQIREARLAKNETQSLAVLEDAEAEYVRAVKSLASVIAKAYEKDGLSARDIQQARIAMEIYTNNGAFAQETMDLLRGLDRAASAAHDDATRAFAHAQASVLLNTLSSEALISAEPLVYTESANGRLSFFDVEAVDQKGDNAADRVIENLGPALSKIQPAIGKEVLIARFSADADTTKDAATLKKDLVARLKVQITQKGERTGFKVFFRDDLKDLKVNTDNAAVLSVRVSEDDQALKIFGIKAFPSYNLEVYLVGAERPTPDKITPVPLPKPILKPLLSRLSFHVDFSKLGSWKTWGVRILAALGAANIIVGALNLLTGLPLLAQIGLVAGGILAVAGLIKFMTSEKGIPSKWKVRIVEGLLVGAGVMAILNFGKKMMVRTAVGAAILAKLTSIFG